MVEYEGAFRVRMGGKVDSMLCLSSVVHAKPQYQDHFRVPSHPQAWNRTFAALP
jgi:hypothetical protein